MKAVVVYESVWGNTAAVARAIAEGIGSDAAALSTAEATVESVADAELIVVGSPVFGFSLPTDGVRKSIATSPAHKDHPPDLSHPSLRSWLDALPGGSAHCAAFETRISWSPRGAAPTALRKLKAAGYRPAGEVERFLVEGTYGPLKEGELDRARAWGATLAAAVK